MFLPLFLFAALPLPSVWASGRCSSNAPSATSPPIPSATPSSSGDLGDEVVATTWFAAWDADKFPAANISWSKYSSVTYSFAIPTQDPTNITGFDTDGLKDFVTLAHSNQVAARLTIGGWTGSRYFSTILSDQNRATFVDTLIKLKDTYKLDGLDFDWEYPNSPNGLSCNVKDPKDAQNFLSFLQELRSQVGQNFTLSAATAITPFLGAEGTPLQDVSAFGDVLDWIAVMDYDIWGSWGTKVGPNAPLNDSCASSDEQQGSAESAVKAWTTAGFPKNKIVLGVAAYGHSFQVSKSNALTSDSKSLVAYPTFDKTQPMGDSWDEVSSVDECGTPINPPSPSGVFNFWGLFDGGFLTGNGTAADGILYRFDDCSQTPYVYNSESGVMVSYDDPRSFTAKGQYISQEGLRGFAMWQAGGDKDDILLDSIIAAIGIQEDTGC